MNGYECGGRLHDETLQFVDRFGVTDENSSSAREKHAQRFPQTTRSRAGLRLAGQRVVGRAHGVDPVVLGGQGALERADLDDLFAGFGKEHDQPGGGAAGAFRRPYPRFWRPFEERQNATSSPRRQAVRFGALMVGGCAVVVVNGQEFVGAGPCWLGRG
jgi:hypothetical protein